MTPDPIRSTGHPFDLSGQALRQAGSRDASVVEIKVIVWAHAWGSTAAALQRALAGLAAMSASTARWVAAALRAVGHAASAALLCLGLGSIPARAGQQAAEITLLALGDQGHGVLSVPMHVDTAGLPAAVVVHDVDRHNSPAHVYVDRLLALGISVLEIEPFRHSTNGGVAVPIVDGLDAAMLVTGAAESLALATGMDARAVGVLGFGAGARAVLLATPAANGRAPLSARVLLYPGCGTLHRPFFAHILQGPQHPAFSREGGAPASPHAAPGGQLLLVHGGRDPGSTQTSCAALASDLAAAADVRHPVMPEAGEAFDRGTRGAMVGPTALPAPDLAGGGPVAAHPTDGLAFAADTVIAFLADALRAAPVHATAR